MAEVDQNHELEESQLEYKPEQEILVEEEHHPEQIQDHKVEQVHQHEHILDQNKPEQEFLVEEEHELEQHELDQVCEHDGQGDPEDGIQENSQPDESVAGGVEKWPGWPGESIFRMLVPAEKVGSIIGRKGEYIKKTCEETKARIKILDGPPGMRDRVVLVSAKEEPDTPLPPAVDGLLRVHKCYLDGLENESSHPSSGPGGKLSLRLLLPDAQAGSLIGKQGTTVKSIQEESNCIVKVHRSDLPVFALSDDRVVEVVGDPSGTHKAIELIASHLRKFLVDRSLLSVIEMQMQMPNSKKKQLPPPPTQHWAPPQSYPPKGNSSHGYGGSPHFMPPPRQFDSYYPPADMQTLTERQPHQGISAYGREASMPVRSSSGQAASSVITQVTRKMQVPLSYADAVIGTQGASISYIRRVSGATVTVQETRGVSGEMTIEIGGTASQIQTAQQLIQNFIAEAVGPPQAQRAPSADYNSYRAPGMVYTSPPTNPTHSAAQTGGHGSVCGTRYDY